MSEEKQTAEQVEAAEQEEVTEQAEQAASQEQHEETAGQEEALQHQIDELQGLLDEKENKLLRVQADFENYKRRSRLGNGSCSEIPFSKRRNGNPSGARQL